MNRYPNLEINLTKIFENTKAVVNRCNQLGVTVTAITKCVGGSLEVAKTFVSAGVCALGDSRIDNLKILRSLPISKWLIRIPMISEVSEVVKYSDLSLNSELKVIRALNNAAQSEGKIHKIILMIDHGDLREGWFDLNEFYNETKSIKKLKNIKVVGIGTNSNCAGAIIPEPKTFDIFPELINYIKDNFKIENPIISGGNSGCYYMVENNTLPSFINNLRFGELLLFGNETSFQTKYDYLKQGVFKLNTEIIELKTKPSFPIGKRGKDAFGKEPQYKDLGLRKRAILGIGKQDIPPEDLIPIDSKIHIIGASSDHLLVDLTETNIDYNIGDIISFNCTYGSGLRASVSDYIKKNIIH